MKIKRLLRQLSYRFTGSMEDWLLASCSFACLLVLVRVVVTDSPMYLFLSWNLLLALIPYWITGWIMKKALIQENKLGIYISLAAWLLFVPNSFYIITDLFHLS